MSALLIYNVIFQQFQEMCSSEVLTNIPSSMFFRHIRLAALSVPQGKLRSGAHLKNVVISGFHFKNLFTLKCAT